MTISNKFHTHILDQLIHRIQKILLDFEIPAWLFYDFQGQDQIARRILKFTRNSHETRRWFYLVPARSAPVKLVHKIEIHTLNHLPGNMISYAGWRELESALQKILEQYPTVAMQYSPNNAIPYISKVDAGTVEMIRRAGTEVVSSADLIQQLEAVWSETQLKSHIKAAESLRKIVDLTFQEIGKRARTSQGTTETEIQSFMMELFLFNNLTTDHPPIVAVNEHSGNPHYAPSQKNLTLIKEGDFVLLDLWGKLKEPIDAVYADITWTGFIGKEASQKHQEIFEIVSDARNEAVKFIENAVMNNQPIYGWQVDDVTRNYITEHGYGKNFFHRTGHSIGTDVHFTGANIDNYETRDTRRLIPHTCFSIEPGIYLPEFGIRSEIDLYIDTRSILVTGKPVQTEIVTC